MTLRQPWFLHLPALGVLFLTCWIGASPMVRADAIDEQLGVGMKELLADLEMHKLVNVGVLRFRAGLQGQTPSFRTGGINLSIATRVEGLLWKFNNKDRKIRLLRDPGGEAAFRGEQASYVTPEGIEKLFRYRYPLHIDTKEPLPADAFITGVAQLSKDRKTTRVQFQILAREDRKLRDLPNLVIDVPTDVDILNEFAEPFALISAGLRKTNHVQHNSLAVEYAGSHNRPDMPPVGKEGDSLVQLIIRYSGVEKKPVKHPTRTGALQVEEPTEKDEVALTLRNISDKQVGVVLAVNGRNTIYQENVFEASGGVAQCTKWILSPGQEVTVKGFSESDDKTFQPFRVLAQAEAATAREDLSTWPNLGVIDLYVFISSEEEGLVVKSPSLRKPLARRGDQPFKDWDAAARDLLAKNAIKPALSKGPIGVAPEKDQLRLETVKFPNPVEQEHRVIWYYEKPK